MPSVSSPALPLRARLYLRLRFAADRRVTARRQRHSLEPLPAHLLTGERGEDLAFLHLRAKGYTVVARRWHAARLRGDLDLVAWDGDTLVVVEVKTRTGHDFSPAVAAVNDAKQSMLRKMATAYRKRIPEPWQDAVPVRFDLLSVYDLPGGVEYDHLRNAFPLLPAREPWQH